MASSLVISNFKTGLETDREPFIINNDAFPTMQNAYVWRGRIQKKRGTTLLGRLQRDLETQALGNTDGAGNFSGNIFTILGLSTSQPDAAIVPGSLEITVGAQVFTEPATPNGTLTNGGAGTGTINYATGALTLNTDPNLAATAVVIDFSYYPDLPVMGLEDRETAITNDPDLVAFDTRYSYQFDQTSGQFYDVSFYKTTGHPLIWTGLDFQQFWSCNYQGAMFVTNNVPGFHFATITAIADQTSATITMTLDNANLDVGDVLWFNELRGAVITNINGFSGTITTDVGAGVYIVTFAASVTVTTYIASSGIAQLLTSSRANEGNGIRWYDGDPTTTAFAKGWVNFAPPLTEFNASTNPNPEYLVGAKIILPFKDRLIVFGAWKRTRNGAAIFYENLVQISQNGTVYYTTNNATPPVGVLIPDLQTAERQAWYENVAGRGDFIFAPLQEAIITVAPNEDVLIVGFETKSARFIFRANDLAPFVFQFINSEFGSQSTFTSIVLDRGVITIGDYGIALTTQVSGQRIDLPILDQVFDISSDNNGSDRVTAFRDYRNEFIYFTYPSFAQGQGVFPNRTLLYNYRDNTWAIFIENYTHYGTFRRNDSYTWATIPFDTWSIWADPWNFGGFAERFPNVIGGNQQGFVMIKDDSTEEDNSQFIQAFNAGTLTITSPDHCLEDGDFIQVYNAIGLTNFNSEIFLINVLTNDTFAISPSDLQEVNLPSGTYLGSGIYRRLTNIDVRTKQFPIYWEGGRQARVGVQRYLMDNAPDGEVTINIFTSQNDNYSSNDPLMSGYLISSNVMLTRPEPGRPNQANQAQIWHRMANSFNGDSVQIGFTLSEVQMRDDHINSAQIGIQAVALELHPGPLLC